MNSVRAFLSGKKVYLLGIAAVLSAAAAYGSGEIELFPALAALWAGAAGIALRAAISKIGS
jgi:hypothetical protein